MLKMGKPCCLRPSMELCVHLIPLSESIVTIIEADIGPNFGYRTFALKHVFWLEFLYNLKFHLLKTRVFQFHISKN